MQNLLSFSMKENIVGNSTGKVMLGSGFYYLKNLGGGYWGLIIGHMAGKCCTSEQQPDPLVLVFNEQIQYEKIS